LACTTVHRALKALAAEGLVAAESRQGYRVRPGANDPLRGCPIAYVFSAAEDPQPWGAYHQTLLSAFQQAAGSRGWTLLAANATVDGRKELLEKLRTARTCGAVLDMHDRELIDFFLGTGLPAVLVNSWREDVQIDVVIQDGQQGGLQAADYLAGRGHKRIAWFGRTDYTGHSLDRLSGAMIGLMRAGLALPPELVVSEDHGMARELLSRPDRPTAVIALWQGSARALAEAAAELGLAVGRDFEMVGWCREEEYDTSYRAIFRPGQVPPAVVWSVATMAEAALERISARRAHPAMPTLRIKIPTRLKMPLAL
jgi:LacI family transcriptional regulator